MRIKQIQMKGFKSFGNRTTIRFGSGVSCIVGPNGCGKSNVVDAFLWVMGETAPKHLRGSSMEDLIFAGAGKHLSSGIAEVSLIMELSKAESKQSQASYGSEIMLTRRLDRDGKSEYFINSRSCRLKDVQEIFMDTGAGVHGFSFIEQGSVESFISSKPEQKRALIESAAGVSKFRSRKKEAERKLDLTEIHLDRLKDILSQQSTQLGKLRKQSENAEQFRDIKKQVQDKDIEISVWDREQIQKERKTLHACIQEEQRKNKDCKKKREKIQARVQEMEKTYQKNKKQLDTLSTSPDSVDTQFVSLEKELAGLQASIQVNKQNLYPQSAYSYRQNRQAILHQIEDSKNQMIHLEKKQKELYTQWEWSRKEYNKSNESCSSLSAKKQLLKTEVMNCQHQKALSQERAQSIIEKIKDGNRREEDWKNLLEQKHQSMQKLKIQKECLRETLDKKKQMSFNVTNSVQELRKRVESLKVDTQSQEENLKKAQMEAKALHSEWSSLKKWADHKSAREKGMRFILQSSNGKNDFTETISSIRLSSPILEKAVSSYMDIRLKSVFCREETSVLSALELLNREKQGVCRFVGLLSDVDSKQAQISSEALRTESGFKFLLKEQVEGNAELINVLFANTAVVEDIQTALRLKRKYPSWCFVTIEGEVLTQEGDLIGGDFPQEREEMNILSYQRAMKELSDQFERKNQQIHALSTQLRKTKTLFHKSSDKLLELSKEGGDFQISILEVNKDLESVKKDQERLISEISDIQKEILECQKQVQELQKKRNMILGEQSSSKVLPALHEELEQVSKECEKEDQEKQKWLKQKDQLWRELAECEKELATMKEKNTILTQSYERGEQDEKQALSHSLEKKTLIQNYENQLKEKERKKQVFQKEMEQKEKNINSLMKEQETLREQINTDQSFVIKLQETLTEQESAINDLKLQFESLLLKKSTLEERIDEKYQIDLNTLELLEKEGRLFISDEENFKTSAQNKEKVEKVAQYIPDNNAISMSNVPEDIKDRLDQQTNKHFKEETESFIPISLEINLAEFDREAEEQELQKLNSKLSRIGEVNLLALKEYEELLQENQFYQKQYEDLCISKDKLLQVIHRIDSFCSRKFKEVFDEVNSCFSKVWPALFEGGQAELVLTKEPEKGLDIIVQPPGKKVQNMNLLSGGEKAMTAVAVIFSIFLVKPPPFCILDEVDAPLDDINIVRFNSLLAEMAKVSQIILITHNKHTMKECSHLYGVTMEEKGISKVISLNMKSIEQSASTP